MQAYFEEGCDIGDVDELVRLGVEAGLSEREARIGAGLARGSGRGRGGRAARRRARHHRRADLHFRRAVLGLGRPGDRDFRPGIDQVAEFAAARECRAREPAELTGRARSHIGDVADPPCALHAHVVAPFLQLRRAAAGRWIRSGSGERLSRFCPAAGDLEREIQRHDGAATMRPGGPIDGAALAPQERIEAILLWSALPGASRHHWGTDLDLIDRRAVAARLSGAADGRGVRAAAGPLRRSPRGWRRMRRASDSSGRFAACSRAFSPSRGISVSRRSRSPRGGA